MSSSEGRTFFGEGVAYSGGSVPRPAGLGLAVGAQDPVLGVPAMDRLRRIVRGAPAPLVLADAGHFVQEHGDVVARAALASFGRAAGD